MDVNAAVDRYYAAKEKVQSYKWENVEFARGQAVAYIWGLQDAGYTMDRLASDAFGWAYGTMHALYQSGSSSSLVSIQDAWRSFEMYGEIRDYNGRALDRIEV